MDLSNAEHYRFGREGFNLTMEDLQARYPEIYFADTEGEVLVDTESLVLESSPNTLDEKEVLFLAASLFDFSVDNRTKAGIPYLTYIPGEVHNSYLASSPHPSGLTRSDLRGGWDERRTLARAQ